MHRAITLLLLLTMQLGTAQNETVIAMKSQVYALTEQLHKDGNFNLQVYKDNLVTLALLKKAAASPELLMTDRHRNLVHALTRTQYAQVLSEDYQGIVNTANANNIQWGKIKYVDFLIKSRASFKLGQPGFEGLLLFEDSTQKGNLFTLKVDFLMLGTEPFIFEMNDLKETTR